MQLINFFYFAYSIPLSAKPSQLPLLLDKYTVTSSHLLPIRLHYWLYKCSQFDFDIMYDSVFTELLTHSTCSNN